MHLGFDNFRDENLNSMLIPNQNLGNCMSVREHQRGLGIMAGSTMAMHLASPTRIRPSRSPPLSGRNAQARASYGRGVSIEEERDWDQGTKVGYKGGCERWVTYHEEWGHDPV